MSKDFQIIDFSAHIDSLPVDQLKKLRDIVSDDIRETEVYLHENKEYLKQLNEKLALQQPNKDGSV